MRVCLDAWAVLAWLADEAPASDRVEAVLDEEAVMSWVNVGEVSYVVGRRSGEADAREVVNELRAGLTLDLPTPRRVLEAAAIKARSRMSYADAFAAATAVAHDAVLLTGDPELLAPGNVWRAEDLRV